MSENPDPTNTGSVPRLPPMSSMGKPLADLIRAGALGQPEHPGQLASLDHFVVVGTLGTGATSDVLLARAPETGDLCAIKLLRPEFCGHATLVARFLAAGRTQQRLEHPNIVHVTAVCARAAGPYLAMPHFPQGSLGNALRPGQPLPTAVALEIAEQVAAALRYAHEQGAIHCDIKPENILLAADGRACLTDFGMARTVANDPVLDATAGPREGTAPYMSPFLAAGIKEDTRCDVYSYGALLYHLLTGRPPYDAPRDQEILARIQAGPPPPIAQVNPEASPGLAAICQGAMEREQRDRYANMADVIADLDRVRAGQTPLGPRGQINAVGLRAAPLLSGRGLLAAGVVLSILMVATWLWPRSPRLVPLHQFTLAGTAADRVAVGDWNSDRVPDLCTLEDDLLRVVALTPTDRPATVWWQDPLRARLCALTNELVFSSRLHVPHTLDLTLVGLLDITGGPAEEALIVGDEGTNVTLSVIDQRGGCIRQFPLDGRIFQDKVTTNRPGRTGVEGVPRLAAASGEGPRQLLVPISTGWGLHPRGLLSFPADGGSALWNNPIAGTPRGIEFFDLGDSNGPCIALGSYAVSNGHTLPDGQSDANCYLHLFDSRGRIRWQHQVGDEYTACEPLAVRTAPDQPQSVYAWVSAAPEVRRPAGKAPVGQILRFDGQKRELSRYDAGACLWTCLAADLDGDGTDEIYATDTAGFLHVLGPDLSAQKLPLTTNLVSSLRTPLAAAAERRSSQPTRAADPDYVALRLMGVGQFPGAKNPCLVLSSWIREVVVNATPDHRPGDPTVIHARQLEIVVLDARLRTVLRHPFAPLSVHPPGTRWLRLADFNRDGFTELLALTDDKATVYAVR